MTHQHQNPLHDITMHVSPSLVRALTAHSGTIRLKKQNKKNTQLDNFWESQIWEWGSIRVEKRVISIFESLNLGLVHLMSVMSTKWLLLDPMVSWRPILQLYRQIAITCTTTHADKAKHTHTHNSVNVTHQKPSAKHPPTQPPPSQA